MHAHVHARTRDAQCKNARMQERSYRDHGLVHLAYTILQLRPLHQQAASAVPAPATAVAAAVWKNSMA